MSDETKLTQLAPLRLTEEVHARVSAAARHRGVRRPEWMRQAIMAELARQEVAAGPTITPEQAAVLKLCSEAEARGVEIRAVLVAALEAKLAEDASEPPAAA